MPYSTTVNPGPTNIRVDDGGAFFATRVHPDDDHYVVVDNGPGDNGIEQNAVSQGISFSTAGDIMVENVNGHTYLITGLVVGVIHPIKGIVKVYLTGTTADGIVLWT